MPHESPLFPFLLAAVVTVLIGVGVWMEPYFAGDVELTRALPGGRAESRMVGHADQPPGAGAGEVLRDGDRAGAVVRRGRMARSRDRRRVSRPRAVRRRIDEGDLRAAAAVTRADRRHRQSERLHVPVHHHHVLLRHLRRWSRVLAALRRKAPGRWPIVAIAVDHAAARVRRPRGARRALAQRRRAHVGDLPRLDLGDHPAGVWEGVDRDRLALVHRVLHGGDLRARRRVRGDPSAPPRASRQAPPRGGHVPARRRRRVRDLAEHAARPVEQRARTASTSSRRRFISASSTRSRSPRRRTRVFDAVRTVSADEIALFQTVHLASGGSASRVRKAS